MKTWIVTGFAAAVAALTHGAFAQATYPTRTITMVPASRRRRRSRRGQASASTRSSVTRNSRAARTGTTPGIA
jgi:hypothetical protein